MVTHYGIGADKVACGRNNHNLVSSKAPKGVTCKTCLATEVYRAAEASSLLERPVVVQVTAAPKVSPIATLVPASRVAFGEWLRKRVEGDRLPRGQYFSGKKAGRQLVAYQVGDSDIVAHYSPEEAAAFMCEFSGYPEGEFTVDDVEAVDASLMNAPMRDEEGNECPPLRHDLAAATVPTYLHGWE